MRCSVCNGERLFFGKRVEFLSIGEINMDNKVGKLFGIPVLFLFLGVVFLVFGANGEGMAVAFSRPVGAASWTTEESTVEAFVFVPLLLGITFLMLFISTFSISFYKLQKSR